MSITRACYAWTLHSDVHIVWNMEDVVGVGLCSPGMGARLHGETMCNHGATAGCNMHMHTPCCLWTWYVTLPLHLKVTSPPLQENIWVRVDDPSKPLTCLALGCSSSTMLGWWSFETQASTEFTQRSPTFRTLFAHLKASATLQSIAAVNGCPETRVATCSPSAQGLMST
jgi:hypothetical protein